MAYATVSDVEARIVRDLTVDEQAVCGAMLDDAAVLIDAVAADASADAKKVVSCRMAIRALGDGTTSGIPTGATQGSMSGLGYSQSWSIGGSGATGEIYLTKTERQILGVGNAIASAGPVTGLVPEGFHHD